MKKIVILITAIFLTATSCFAELYPFTRFFEVGTDVTVDVDQNAVTVPEVFTKDVVIDLTALADSMGDDGMIINANGDADLFINTNFGSKFGMGLFFDVDASARIGLSKDLFTFLGHGNELDTPIVTAVSASLEAYAEVGTTIKMKFGKFGVKVTPSYFLPLVYMPQPTASVTVTTATDGTMTAVGDAFFSIYSLIGLSSVFDENFQFMGFDSLVSAASNTDSLFSMLSNGGVDLNATVEYPLFRSLDVGVYTRVPIVAGKLNYVTSGNATYSATVNPILTSYAGGDAVSFTSEGPTFSGVSYGEETYSVNRPLRLGIEGAWRPFGKWCTFRPLVGFAARNPFGEDFSWSTSVYPEYSLAADMRFFYVLGLNLATEYKEQVFLQSFGLTLNFRVFEVDLKVASSSASFVRSWQISGAKAVVGLRVGF